MPSSQHQHLICPAKAIVSNPSPAKLRELVLAMPNARTTAFDNINVSTKVLARSKASTYVVADDPSKHTDQTITRSQFEQVAKLQDTYIAQQEMIVIEGYIGPDPASRVAVRLMVEAKHANIAAMQQQLYFAATEQELANFQPAMQILYTPSLPAAGFPNDRLIAVDLDHYVTRIFNSDYFGESKKAGLRMWNKWIYDRGGLAMHAGCKMIPSPTGEQYGLIIGLSGTGKTTTTFTQQGHSKPLQDDFIALLPDGQVLASEAGCFAKTYGLAPKSEPVIYHAVVAETSYLENVSVKEQGKVDFFDESYTQNGRATFSFASVPSMGDIRHIPQVHFILILNRNENVIPAIAKLHGAQAAAFFMLGETKGTSAGGVEEAGKALRVPGTNPFFPLRHDLQGKRFLELIERHPMAVYLMNTGCIGGPAGTASSKKVTIEHSSAILQGIVDNTITWQQDPDFGYHIATNIPGIAEQDHWILQPKRYYAHLGQDGVYQQFVQQLKQDRVAHLRKYPDLPASLISAIS